ncbi:MAG TPA: YncE family protein [Candidatus Angelobacter sp.]|jgi:DNA-binding beta-propeller fold protein YncE|nr:YncE family protein [Candidatus Angelobacter sp.]
MRKQFFLGMVLVCALVLTGSAAGPVKYELKHAYKIGGEGFWDYLTYDSASKRLFISRDNRVMVMDPDKIALEDTKDMKDMGTMTEIMGTDGVHGIALANDLGKGFTSNGRENSVTVFDLKTLKETNKIKIDGQNPDAILYDPASKRVFTFNGRSKDATVIDATKGTVVATIPLDGKPEFAAADGKGMVYVNIEDKSELTKIDARNAKVVTSWPLAPCESPSGLSIDTKTRRLFSGCHNKLLAVVNADTGKVVTTLPIGEGVDATAFDPGTKLVFSSNGRDGTLTVIQEESADKFSVVQNAETQKNARTMAVNPNNHEVYLVTAEIEQSPGSAGQPPRRRMKGGSFAVLIMEKK